MVQNKLNPVHARLLSGDVIIYKDTKQIKFLCTIDIKEKLQKLLRTNYYLQNVHPWRDFRPSN